MAEVASFNSVYSTVERGTPNSTDYRLFFKDKDGPISPVHDIPLYIDAEAEEKVYNAVVVAPRWSNAKFRVSVKESLNPIRQESKKGKLRYVANCFPHHGYIWNYCVLTQTWRSRKVFDDDSGIKGNNYLVELLEIGFRVAAVGEVIQVKILGSIVLKGEICWKIIGIDVNDPMAPEVNDLSDVVEKYPGLLKATFEWYKLIPVSEGKTDNPRSSAEVRDSAYAQNIVTQSNILWQKLVMNKINSKSISCLNTSVIDSPYRIHSPDAEVLIEETPPLGSPKEAEDFPEKWHFIRLE